MNTGKHNPNFQEDYTIINALSEKDNTDFIKVYNENMEHKSMLWFYENYIDSQYNIDIVLDTACKYHACSIQSLYESCKELCYYRVSKFYLKNDIKYFTKLADNGISGRKAGEMVHAFLVVQLVLNKKTHEKPQ